MFSLISKRDNVATTLCDMNAGEVCGDVILQNDIPRGHKFALCDMQNGDNIIKYAAPDNDLVSSTALAISGAH